MLSIRSIARVSFVLQKYVGKFSIVNSDVPSENLFTK